MSLHHPGHGDGDAATTAMPQERHPSLPRTPVKGSVLLFQGFFFFYSYQLSSPSPCAAPKPPSSDHKHPTGESSHRVRGSSSLPTCPTWDFTLTAQTLTMNGSWLSHSSASTHGMPGYLCPCREADKHQHPPSGCCSPGLREHCSFSSHLKAHF